MSIPPKYDPAQSEEKWYKHWSGKGYFHSSPDEREPFVITIPPPNVTGVLHMGHMLNNTLQDVLVRRARMMGRNACWVPGTDHASIATEARVVNKLKNEGIDKNKIGRGEFLKHAWEWTHKHGGIILEQLKKLGASCDWERTAFTMDKGYYESVIQVFVDLHEKGLIYRGVRMINWDPQAKTAVSDEEVFYREVNSKLYHVRYPIVGQKGQYVTIATTRPETILGDTAVCVNPKDTRYSQLKGKQVEVPLTGRTVPLIEDEYVDMEFGTGALKITPAHDINDYEIGMRHNLDSIDIFNDDGTLNQKAGLFVGEDRAEARKLMAERLEKEGYLVKTEDYTNKVGYSERTDAVIEPKLSTQWFLNMQELSKPALKAVMEDEVQLHPAKFKNTYRHWMENVKDWCISRQLWWGHRIPAWFIGESQDYVVAMDEDGALAKAKEKTGNAKLTSKDLKQDPDVLDTWFSSWLWPIAVFDGIREPDNKDINYYYPTNDLVTAPEILFFWVARMIIAGYEYRGEKPFGNVYLTGIVRDQQRRKMSKSLGNSPEPLELIKEYGADGVRVGMMLCSPAGNDLLFDNSLPEQGRNFGNKIWNAFRLVSGWEEDGNAPQPEHSAQAGEWFRAKLNESIAQMDDHFNKYRMSDALMCVYRLFWDDFASWYLEAIKPPYQKPVDSKTRTEAMGFFADLLKLLHPFMPFITEELWHLMQKRGEGEDLIVSRWPGAKEYDKALLKKFEAAKDLVTQVRNIRTQKNIPPKEALKLIASGQGKVAFANVVVKLANLDEIEMGEKPEGAISFLSGTRECYVPMAGLVDTGAEIKKLDEELNYTRGFLKSVMKKLSNDKFVNHAPEQVVANERKKQADAESKIRTLEKSIAELKKG